MNAVVPIEYVRNPEYESRPHQGGWLICHCQDGCIWTDDLVHAAWQATGQPRTPDQLYDALNPQYGVSNLLLRTLLRVLEAADLIHPSVGVTALRASPLPDGPIYERGTPAPSLISVIVLDDANEQNDLLPCLSSVSQQTHPPVETLVVSQRSPATDQARHVPLEPGASRVTAANRGIAAARGEILFLLDSGIELDPCCLEEALAVMSGSPDIGAVAPQIRFPGPRHFVESIGVSVGSSGWEKGNCQGYLDLGQFDDMGDVFAARLEAILLRRQVVERAGLLDERYGRYYEDVDWCYRARLAGYRTVAAPRAIAAPRIVADREPVILADTPLPGSTLGQLLRNRLRFALKDLNWGSTLWLLYSYWREDTGHALLATGRDRRRAWLYISSWLRFALSSPEILWRRWGVRRTKQKGLTDRSIFDLTLLPPIRRMKGPYPVLSLTAIRAHYIHLWRPSGQVTWREVHADLETGRGPGSS